MYKGKGKLQTGFATYHIFSNKKHVNSYDQNGQKPSHTLHYPKKDNSIKQFEYFYSQVISHADCFGGKQPEAVTSRGQIRWETTGDCNGHGTLKKGGKPLEAVMGPCDTKWQETTGRSHEHGLENKTLSLL